MGSGTLTPSGWVVEEIDSAVARVTTNPLTGGLALAGPDGPIFLDPRIGQPVTNCGSFTGNATSQSINVGFEPDLILIKSSAAASAVIQTRMSWHRRSDSLINQESIGDASTPTGADTGGGVTITSTGFDVGGNSRVNGSAATIYWFAYKDQGAGDFLQSSYAGNAITGRTVEALGPVKLTAAMCKRDYTPAPVWMFPGIPAYYWNGTSMAVSSGTSLSADGSTITTGAGNEINGWTGALGEAMGLYGFPQSAESSFAMTYVGNATASRRINLPWEVDAFLIIPLNTTTATSGRMWVNGLAANTHLPIGAGASGTGAITVVSENTVVLSADASVNANGLLYGLIAWRKCRSAALFDTRRNMAKYRKAIQLASGGYIDCGAHPSLDISGALTMEFLGSAHPPSTTPMAGGAGVDTESGKQSPIMFRSGGNDGSAGGVSYGFELCAPTAHDSSSLSRGASILVATRDVWTLPQDGAMPNLDPYPMNTGYVLGGRLPDHIMVTHDGNGTRRVYVNGVQVKERKRDLSGTYGNNGIAYAGHKLIFGGRKESGATPTDTNGHSFRMARIYSRELTPAECYQNWLSVIGYASAVGDFVEEWTAGNATGTTLTATRNSGNNGTIVGGVIDG